MYIRTQHALAVGVSVNEHGIRILYFSNLGDDYSYPYKVFNSLEELLKDNTETTIIT